MATHENDFETQETEKELKRLIGGMRPLLAALLVLVFVAGTVLFSFTSCGPVHDSLDDIYGDTSDSSDVESEVSGEDEASYDLAADYERFLEIYELISENYIGKIEPEEMMQNALEMYVASLGDPYSQYMTKVQSDSFIDGDYGKKVGIGVRIYMTAESEGMIVYYIFDGAPADKAGIQKGDIITAVDGVAVTYENYKESVDRVGGTEGTTVKLTVKRGGESLDIDVVRGSFVVSSIEYRLLESEQSIGYIRIDSLASDTAKAFEEAVKALQSMGAEKYIFDVREDSGGYLSTIVKILDMLLPEGPIVRWTLADGTERSDNSKAGAIVEAPMAVIINGNTASAAELFAAALKDYKLATLVGETTYGKGVMQTLYPLDNGDTLKLTTSMYSPPFSENYNGVGVKPDVEVSLPEDKIYYMVSEEEDTQLQAAIDALKAMDTQD
ncbi:MAG: S41 family peptidase [Clostridia bacterium]|nr:S41 family peptidase [Clostridia bacterium]